MLRPLLLSLFVTSLMATDAAADLAINLTGIRILNADSVKPPPSEFNPGHVKIVENGGHQHQSTESGWQIQLPSQAWVATPTVVGNRVYVSGGFQSTTFFAFAFL